MQRGTRHARSSSLLTVMGRRRRPDHTGDIMLKHSLKTVAVAGFMLAVGCVAASAQTASLEDGKSLPPNVNDRLAMQYDQLVAANPGFRATRIQQECGPIDDAAMKQQCLDSFKTH